MESAPTGRAFGKKEEKKMVEGNSNREQGICWARPEMHNQRRFQSLLGTITHIKYFFSTLIYPPLS